VIKLKENPLPGVKISIGGHEMIVPGLDMKRLRKVKRRNPVLSRETVFDIAMKIIHQALQRNYPEITLDEVEDLVDAKNAIMVLGEIKAATLGRIK